MASRGLPTNPRPRAKSAAAPPPPRPSVQDHALPVNPRAGPSSMTLHRRGQDAPSNPISARRSDHSDQSLEFADSRRTYDSSPTSSTSSTSSFWARGNVSPASSRTTLPSEGEEERHKGQQYYSRSRHPQASQSETADASGFTWNKVAEAANVFTQEVNKVWTAGLNPLGLSGAHADAGQEDESHLCRVMRAYHLSKAQTPSELPDWLFSAKERGLGGLLSQDTRHHNSPNTSDPSRNHLGTSYRNLETGMNSYNSPAPTSRALPLAKSTGADRLKMLREARRNEPGQVRS